MFPHSLERASFRALRELVRRARAPMLLGVVFALGACSGDSARAPARAGGVESGGATTPARTESSGASGDTPAAPREVLAKGDSIFHGLLAGGTCQACHGVGGKGGTLAPDLTDGTWLHGDGSMTFLVRIVTSGVAAPKQYPAPMPPMGGASLSPSDVQAVAAYVSALSTGRSRP
ncbi:MAG: hypothetical protein AMXMBFR55_16240 [Gemmatimonadota bacterium]